MSVSISLQALHSHLLFSLVIVTDDGNKQAENGVDTAIKYLTQNNIASINKKSVLSFMDEEPAQAVEKGEV